MGFHFVNKEIFNNNPDNTIVYSTALNTRKLCLLYVAVHLQKQLE